MNQDYKKDIFLHNCSLPGKISGSRFMPESGLEVPLVGITGWGIPASRNGTNSAWIYGEIISPTFVMNDSCAGRSHIEGIIADNGEMRFLEAVYDFMAHEGDCFDYTLQVKDHLNNLPEFKGNIVARLNRNGFKPKDAGKINLVINPSWKIGNGSSRNYTLPYNHRHFITGTYIPKFWRTFLGELEEKGYDHPYEAVTETLTEERAAQVETKGSQIDEPSKPLESSKDNLPF